MQNITGWVLFHGREERLMLDIILIVMVCSLLGGFTFVVWACAWDFFEDTELWEIIKDKMTRKEE